MKRDAPQHSGNATNTVVLHFLKPGMYTTIQDSGRPGHQDRGIPVGGAMDTLSAATANAIVGNAETEPVLEITMKGPLIRFDRACQIAITGADMKPMLNDAELPRYTLLNIEAESELRFDKLRNGCRAYIAVRGTWHTHRWLGSASALAIGGVDLVPGAILHKGASLSIVTSTPLQASSNGMHPAGPWPTELDVHVLAGPEFKWFSAGQIASFFNTAFTVRPESNRIGYRLDPVLPAYIQKSELISSGIVPGTIQVTRDGQPIILMADAQTTGGYPRIANVLASDICRLAQLKPGDEVRFKIVKARSEAPAGGTQ